MTTFHDPPPQSRRAARQSERNRAPEEQPTEEGFTTFPSQEVSENPVEDSRATPDAESARAATPPAASAVPPAPATSQPSTDAAYRAAPPPVVQAQDSAFSPLPPATSASPRDATTPDRTLTRRELRELRARQDAESNATAAADQSVTTQPETPDAVTDLSAMPAPRADAEAVPPYPYSDFAGRTEPAAPQPLALDPDVLAYIEPPALVDPLAVVPEAASSQAAPEDALSAFESLLANADGSSKDSSLSDAPRSPLVDLTGDSVDAPTDSTAPVQPADEQPQSSTRTTLQGLLGLAPEPAREDVVSAIPPVATNLSNARAEFDELARKRLDADLPAVTPLPSDVSNVANVQAAPTEAPSPPFDVSPAAVSIAPAGHWTRQATAEDDDTSNAVVTRTIGSGSSTTSALVLPAIPFATDIRGPLNSSGEAMLTGSIDLPNTLSASGVSDRFDHADIDSLLDLNDSDMVSTDSAPVRAVKAVSTFSNQSVTQTQKPKGTRALTVLLISASSMAVVVAGLLVAAFAFNML